MAMARIKVATKSLVACMSVNMVGGVEWGGWVDKWVGWMDDCRGRNGAMRHQTFSLVCPPA